MKLSPQKIEECAQWVRENGLTEYGGATIKTFCEAIGIDRTTFYHWKENATFSTAIEKAKIDFKNTLEVRIVQSLAKTAMGYTYVKKKTEYKTNKDGKAIIAKQTHEDIDVAPNVGAGIFLLTNINPERWKNKISNDVNANVKSEVEADVSYGFEDVPDEMLFALADKMQEAQFKRKKAEKE